MTNAAGAHQIGQAWNQGTGAGDFGILCDPGQRCRFRWPQGFRGLHQQPGELLTANPSLNQNAGLDQEIDNTFGNEVVLGHDSEHGGIGQSL